MFRRIVTATFLIAPIFAFATTKPSCNPELQEQDNFLSWTTQVSASILKHSIEKRGFIKAPLNWEDPAFSRPVNVFYRLIPAENGDVNDSSKPIVVYINGGPGYPSHRYHDLDFDYSNKDPEYQDKHSKFTLLRKSFRILLVDQRGTDGMSCPMNLDCSEIDPLVVAKFTGPEAISMDYAAAIAKVVPKKEKFYIIAQSYGGYAGVYYMVNAQKFPKQVRTPDGIVFSSSAFPFPDADPLVQTRIRRRSQLDLNQQLAKAFPDIPDRIRILRARVDIAIPGSTFVDCLFFMLGKGDHWEKQISDKVDEFLVASDTDLKKLIEADELEPPPPMNYILSPATFQNGLSDRAMARQIMAEIPFDKGMINEMAIYVAPIFDTNHIMNRTDANPPRPTNVPSTDKIREALTHTSVIFTGANNDPMVPLEASRMMIAQIAPPNAQIVELNGGHSAIMFAEGYDLLKRNWLPKKGR